MSKDGSDVRIGTGIKMLDALLGRGIRIHGDNGFFGVIFGAAGTGKSVLGMQLCCGYVLDGLAQDKRSKRTAIYVTQEPADLIKEKIVEGFCGFLENFPKACGALEGASLKEKASTLIRDHDAEEKDPTRIFTAESVGPAVHICTIPLERGPQTDMLENVFDIVASMSKRIHAKGGKGSRKPKSRKGTRERQDWPLVCVDNVNLIVRDALRKALAWQIQDDVGGDRRKHVSRTMGGDRTDEDPGFFHKLRHYWSKQRVNTFLIFEETARRGRDPEGSDISRLAQAYAADLVLHLGIQTYPVGYRARFIEIVKARNQFHHRGRHPFSIVSQDGGGSPDRPERGITIYPSVVTQLYWLPRKLKKESSDWTATRAGTSEGKGEPRHACDQGEPAEEDGAERFCNLGIADLDTQIDNVARRQRKGYILCGSSTVLASDLDVLATEIALHFAAQRRFRALYISFLHGEQHLKHMARDFEDIARRADKIAFKYFPPEYISEPKLMLDIDHLLRDVKGKARDMIVVVDNVFELGCKYPLLGETRHFLPPLFELFRARGVTSFIVDMVEAGEGRNPLEASLAAGLADNVFLMRHVEFQSQPRHVFSALKLPRVNMPEFLWDLEKEDAESQGRFRLKARDTFDRYRNVLSGKPEPVKIKLTLYKDAETSAFRRYLAGQQRALEQSFGAANMEVNLYGAEEYARVQSTVSLSPVRQMGECHVAALDEFWLQRLIEKGALHEIGDILTDSGKNSEYDRRQFVSAAQDIALYTKHKNKPQEALKHGGDWLAVPVRNNCGVLCCHPHMVRSLFGVGGSDGPATKLVNVVNRVPEAELTWGDLLDLKRTCARSLRDTRRSAIGPTRDKASLPEVFFTFCMDGPEACVSFLLEIALSEVGREKVMKGTRLDIEAIEPRVLQILFGLLDKDKCIRQLANGKPRPSDSEPRALVSRQWFSTLGCLRARDDTDYFLAMKPFALPWGSATKHPTPVSGTWYLGVLRESTALKAGVEVIKQFTSVADELYKVSNYMGLPVRDRFYKNSPMTFLLPYSERFYEISEIQRRMNEALKGKRPEYSSEYLQEIIDGDYPFYRMRIEDYEIVSPIIWRMIVHGARAIIAANGDIAERDMNNVVKRAAGEYEALAPKSK